MCLCCCLPFGFPGAVMWVRGLKERLQEPMDKLLGLDRSTLELPAFRSAQHKFEVVMAEMQQFEAGLVQDWCEQVGTALRVDLCWVFGHAHNIEKCTQHCVQLLTTGRGSPRTATKAHACFAPSQHTAVSSPYVQ